MKAAHAPVQRPRDAKLLVVGKDGAMQHALRSALADFARKGDVVVANDAATLPASLRGVHLRTQRAVEVRLAGRESLAMDDVREFTAVLFGDGDHRTPTEQREPPPPMLPGDVLELGPLRAVVQGTLGHPRLVRLRFDGSVGSIWSGFATHGRPVQYAHIEQPLALWDVWTRIAALPVAFEPPSAGFLLDWGLLSSLKARGVAFATLTHAAGLSSTGDAGLDSRLPLDEPYCVPASTVESIQRVRAARGRVIALGTTVTRALEHAARDGTLRAGHGVANQRIGPKTALRVVDAIVSGTHEPGTSHYELLRAFNRDEVLAKASLELEQNGYRTHEFGDSVWMERRALLAAPSLAH